MQAGGSRSDGNSGRPGLKERRLRASVDAMAGRPSGEAPVGFGWFERTFWV